MALLGALAAGGALLGGIGSIISGVQEQQQGKMNYDLAREQYEWQKGMAERILEREDNAMQRRVEDLKAAGLNPILAVGGPGAGAQPVQNIPAPQRQGSGKAAKGVSEFGMSGTQAIQAYQGIQANQAVIEKTLADARAANATANRSDAETSRVLGTTPFDIQLKEAEAKIADTLAVHQDEKSVAEIRQLISNTSLNDARRLTEEANRLAQEAHTRLMDAQSRTEALRPGQVSALTERERAETALSGQRLTREAVEIARAEIARNLEESMASVTYLRENAKYMAELVAAKMVAINLTLLEQEAEFRLEKGLPQNVATRESFNESLLRGFEGLQDANTFLRLLKESIEHGISAAKNIFGGY